MSVPLLDDAVRVAYPIFWHLATLTGPAVAIVLATLAVRLLLLPLTLLAVRGERARAALAPEVKALQERHRADPARLGRELRALYRRSGTNPLAGCLPLLVQAPFFLVTYRLFLSPKVGGAGNALLHAKVFGAALSTHLVGGGHPLVFLPFVALLAGLAWLGSRRIRRLGGTGSPAGAAWLPYTSLISAAVLPLAAVLYLVTTNAWTAAENAVLRRR